MSDQEWRLQAKCRGVDTELFFPTHSTIGKRRPQVRKMAAQYCLHCPVRRECFEDALRAGDHYGIRGGYDMQAARVREFMQSARTLQQVQQIEHTSPTLVG